MQWSACQVTPRPRSQSRKAAGLNQLVSSYDSRPKGPGAQGVFLDFTSSCEPIVLGKSKICLAGLPYGTGPFLTGR